jgi:hypothetical protein
MMVVVAIFKNSEREHYQKNVTIILPGSNGGPLSRILQ